LYMNDKKKWFYDTLKNGVIILDGATGTELQKYGMEAGYCPELLNIENKEMIQKVYKSYIDAGSMIIEANTFGGNRYKLEEFGLESKIVEINSLAIEQAKEMAGDRAKVFASISSTGKVIEPMGKATFEEIYDVYAEQAEILEKAGADGIIIETMIDIKEMKAAAIACKSVTSLPIIASMTFQADGRAVTGTDPRSAAIILDGIDVDAIGINCSLGPEKLLEFAIEMKEVTNKPIFVQPNAGLPKLVGDKTVFDLSPEYMADYYEKFYEAGVNILGGCCGTTPLHINALADRLKGRKPNLIKANLTGKTYFSSGKSWTAVGKGEMVKMLGERINPNALKAIKEDVKGYGTAAIRKEAIAQSESGATMLDVNVGLGTIDEAVMMKKAVMAVENVVTLPLSIDTTDITALEEGLKVCSGKPLVNSVTGKEESLKAVLPLVKKYGAAVLGLTIDEEGIPALAEDRLRVARKIVETAMSYGIKREDILIDTLVLTASAEQERVMDTVKAIGMVKRELGVNTTIGLSNVSFGLPERKNINGAFLAMCIAEGLDMPIINPNSKEMRDILMASCVITGRDKNSEKYIAYTAANSGMEKAVEPKSNEVISADKKLYTAVLRGGKDEALTLTEVLIAEGKEKPIDIINKILIPAITEVGELYDKGKYFLPQLIMSAETMKGSVERLKLEMKGEKREVLGKIVFATVKNDIHDIGKNIVNVLLENNGFDVIDLGKDVSSEKIINAIKSENPDIVGLSALMTTTMIEMRKTIEAIREEQLDVKIMVGGAVVTSDFAESMGVNYSTDAVDAVRVAKIIVGK
jgi:5-methyltetrahydrofolate--homocysteine methyltransferase